MRPNGIASVREDYAVRPEMGLAGALESILQELRRKARGIKGSVVADSNGLAIASDVDGDFDLGVIAAMSTLITQSADTVCVNMSITAPGLVFLESREANIAVMHLGNGDASFLTLLDKNANVGLLRIEMKRAAAKLAAVLGLPSGARPVVTDLFVLHNDGTLIRHFSDKARTSTEEEGLGGMLAAVQQFARQALAIKARKLSEFRYGEYTICLVRGTYSVALIVIRGPGSEDVQYPVSDALEEFEARFSGVLKDWNGDTSLFPGMDDIFARIPGN